MVSMVPALRRSVKTLQRVQDTIPAPRPFSVNAKAAVKGVAAVILREMAEIEGDSPFASGA